MNNCDLKNIIKSFSDLSGVSGYEQNSARFAEEMFLKYTDNVKINALGSITALRKNDFNIQNPKKIMIEAHIDEIGLMVSDIDENGFLKFVPIGGIDARILPALEVVVHGKSDIYGIIGSKPPHILDDDEKNTAFGMDKLYIDTGYDADELKTIVSIGDTVTFYNEFTELNGDYVSTKAQDDRTSCAVLIVVLDMLKNTKIPYDIYFTMNVQEEVGLRGAKTTAYDINPDYAIAIDVCHGSTPDAHSLGTVKCSSGVVVTKGPNIHKGFLKNLLNALNNKNISYNIEAVGGDTGTDAWAIQTAKEGIPTILLSLPLKYMHTPVETLSVADVKTLIEAIFALITSGEEL